MKFKKIVKEAKKPMKKAQKKEQWWFDIPGAKHIYHGDWSDPEIQYKGFATLEPYALFELKATLNDPTCKATWNSAAAAYTDYSFTGYNDSYLSRYRGGLGLEWKLSPVHALNFYGLFDYYYEKAIDTNRAGCLMFCPGACSAPKPKLPRG